MRGAIRNFFETRTPYRCDEAGDGFSAIQSAEANHCELVVLDLNMPKPNGVETASTLRRKLPQVKIVGFSALARDPDFREKLLASKDFDAVLSKFDGLDTLAEVHFQRGEKDKAREIMQRCIALEGKTAYFRKQLARFEAGNPAADVPEAEE